MLVRGGETLSLGGDVTVSVHAIPGHTAGSVAYVVDGQDDVFVGDAVQVHGAANGFPGYEDPRRLPREPASTCATRSVRGTCTWATRTARADGVPYGVELDREQAQEALQGSLDIEARVADAARGCLAAGLQETDSPYSPFARVAEELGYTGDPTLEPSPFFTTLHGYRTEFDHD